MENAAQFTKDFTVTNNRIEHFSQVTNDSGGIYSPNPSYGTNIITGNYIKGDYLSIRYLALMGLYHDAAGANWTDTENVVENVTNWTGAQNIPSSNAIKTNIESTGNYVNRPLKGAYLSTETNNIHDNIQVEGYDYDETAQSIIQNSGLQPEFTYLTSLPAGDIEADTNPTVLSAAPGQESNFSLELSNHTSQPQTVLVTSGQKNQLLTGYQESVTLQPGEQKAIPISFSPSDDCPPELFEEQLVLSYGGKTKRVTLGVEISLPLADSGVFTYLDPTYQELTGSWDNSGLQGYGLTKSRYGFGQSPSASWTNLGLTGDYELSFYNIQYETSATEAIITVKDQNGETDISLNQVETQTGWVSLGTFSFSGAAEEGVYIKQGISPSGQESFLRTNAIMAVAIQ